MQSVVEKINELCAAQPFNTHWYLKDLKTGEEANGAGDVSVPSASTRKIAILMTALKKINEGEISLDDPFPIEEQYQRSPSGCFGHLTTGMQVRMYDALVMMIIVSDNAATGKICEIIGLDAVNELCQSIGMNGTVHRTGWGSASTAGLAWDHPVDVTNVTTANDLGRLLDHIVHGADDADVAAKLGCTSDQCKLALDILSWQKYRNQLPFFLPMGTKVANKTGVGVRNYNDAGVIYADDAPRYIMTGLTDWVPVEMPNGMPGDSEGYLHVGRICRAAWDGIVG